MAHAARVPVLKALGVLFVSASALAAPPLIVETEFGKVE